MFELRKLNKFYGSYKAITGPYRDTFCFTEIQLSHLQAHSGSSGEDGDDDDQSDDGSGSDGDADDASSQCVSSGEEAGMLVSADTGSADEAYEEFMRETASPQQAVPASQDEDLIAKKAHEEFLKEAASPEQAVPASQHEDSIAEKAYQEFLKEAESPKQAVPASPSESLNEMLATMYDSGDEKACEAKSVNDPGHGATIEISDSPVVKVEKTHDFEALSNSPRFKEVRQKLQKLKQLRECLVCWIVGDFLWTWNSPVNIIQNVQYEFCTLAAVRAKRLKRKEAEHLPGQF